MPAVTNDELGKIRTLIDSRNGELHGDMDELCAGKATDFLPSIYSITVKLAEFSGEDLSALLGPEESAQAKSIADATAKDRKRRISDLIKIQKERFFSRPDSEKAEARQRAKPSFTSAVMKTGHQLTVRKCPSCAELGLLVGTPVGRSGPIIRDGGIYQEVRAQPEVFECKCCDLKIKGLDELLAAGFEHEFVAIDNKDPVEYFNVNPLDYVDTHEIIREYGHEFYEYQDE